MIRWTDIEAECGNYRDGFIAVFRKYEGEPTDEKDAYNRVVTVTTESFARHMGIEPSTFRRWLKKTGAAPVPETRDRVAEGIRNLSPERKAEVARELIRSEPEVARAVAGDPQALSAMQRHQQPTEPGIPVDEAREIVRQAEQEAGPDVVHPITRINLIVGELKADFDAEEVAVRLLEYQRPDVIRSLGESVEFLAEVHRLATKARKPQVVG